MLQVKVNNMKYQVGRVEYDVPETFSFPMEAIAGIAAGGGFLLLIIILILIIYRRQSTRAERIYHKLQIQLDNLESNVRNECKQGRGWGGGGGQCRLILWCFRLWWFGYRCMYL